MSIRSLGYRTEMIFPRFEGEITERDEYIVIRTPSNPHFFWGNYLLYRQPPRPGDYPRWCAAFEREIGSRPEVQHIAFGIDTVDGTTGDVQPFLDAGFSLQETVVLTAAQVNPPPKHNEQVTIRPLVEEWEYRQAIENQIASRDEVYSEAGYRLFQERKFDRYRRMTAAGLGHWFGAFLGDQLVSDLGIYREGSLARFQSVETLPEYRRQGICGTLVYQAARYAYQHMGAEMLVMLADEHYFAARIYESVGFRPTENIIGLEWFQP
jgi:GNAT superfamily N-acetyltransferase